jgi:hypothetical protein
VGRDLARVTARPSRRLEWLPPVLTGVLLAALGIAALRMDLIRVRYALTEAIRTETELKEQRRELLARVQALRDPARLQGVADERGFGRPERVIELPADDESPR